MEVRDRSQLQLLDAFPKLFVVDGQKGEVAVMPDRLHVGQVELRVAVLSHLNDFVVRYLTDGERERGGNPLS